jgi:hypothetical protein
MKGHNSEYVCASRNSCSTVVGKKRYTRDKVEEAKKANQNQTQQAA